MTTAVPMDEAAFTAAVRSETKRLFSKSIADGYKPERLDVYTSADGAPLFARYRGRRADGAKYVRPVMLDAAGRVVIGEPPAPAAGKPLFRLHKLAQADIAEPVMLVEGEPAAVALEARGIVATTSGSASSADAADWQPLAGRHIIVWPDNDAPGQNYAADCARALAGIGCTVEIIDAAALALPEHGDAVNWIRQNPDATSADVLSLPRAPAPAGLSKAPDGYIQHRAATAPDNEPEPLRRAPPAAAPYPIESLGSVMHAAALDLERIIQAPQALIANSLLAAASFAAQGLADVRIDGRVYPLSLWFLTVGESGERKSAVDRVTLTAARRWEDEQGDVYAVEHEQYQADLAQWKAEREHAEKQAKKTGGAGLSAALMAQGEEPPLPLLARQIVRDFTIEGLSCHLTKAKPTCAAFTDEGAIVFGGHSMKPENAERTAGTLCKLFDDGSLEEVRANQERNTRIRARRLAVHLMAQPIILQKVFSNAMLRQQGFLPRTLLAWPQSNIGERPYDGADASNTAAMLILARVLYRLHSQPLPTKPDKRQELDPRALTLSPEAKTRWIEIYNALERSAGRDGQYHSVKAWAVRTPEQILRVAGVLALMDDADALHVEQEHIDRAAAIAVWHLHEVARVLDDNEAPEPVRDAEKLLAWLHRTGRGQTHATELATLSPVRNREARTAALAELERTGWLCPLPVGTVIDGNPRKLSWTVHPATDTGNAP